MFSSRPQLEQFFSRIFILFCSSFYESEKLPNCPKKVMNLYLCPLISVSHYFYCYYLLTVLGQLPPMKIAPNPKSNPNPNSNPHPSQGANFLGGNCPDLSANNDGKLFITKLKNIVINMSLCLSPIVV